MGSAWSRRRWVREWGLAGLARLPHPRSGERSGTRALASVMPTRTIAIGDIHGCSQALDALLGAIAPRTGNAIVTLGDYINRGPDCRGVLDRLSALGRCCRLVPLRAILL